MMKYMKTMIIMALMIALVAAFSITASASELVICSEPKGAFIVGAMEDASGKKYNFTLDDTNDWTQTLELKDGSYEIAYANILIGEGSIVNCIVAEGLYYVPMSVTIPESNTLTLEFSTIKSSLVNDATPYIPEEPNVEPVVNKQEQVELLNESFLAMVKILPVMIVVSIAAIVGVIAAFQYSKKTIEEERTR